MNLHPLKWTQKNLNPLAELELTAYSALHEYEITEPKQGKFELKKTRLSKPDKKSEFLPYFDTVKEAQDWAWAHYQRSMQPYVVPSPTWFNYKNEKPKEGDDVVITWLWMGDRHTIHLGDYSPRKIDYLDDAIEVYWSISPFLKQGE